MRTQDVPELLSEFGKSNVALTGETQAGWRTHQASRQPVRKAVS
jgi:hypothetical protein